MSVEARALDAPLGSPSRPTWRGLLHLIALLVAIPLLVALTIVSNGGSTRFAPAPSGVVPTTR